MRTTIVSAYNSKVEMTRGFLDTMQKFTVGQDVEMILVNGGSDTKIEHPFITKRIDRPVNIGFCATLNHGLTEAINGGADYIFFVGNDSFPIDGNWLPNLQELLNRSGAWQVCPANDNPGMEYRKGCYYKDCGDYWLADWFPSIAWLMERNKVERVGLLDEGYIRTGMHADNDYCDRIHFHGGTIAVSKNIMLKHLCSQEGSALGTHGADMQINAEHYAKRAAERRALVAMRSGGAS